MRTLTDRRIDTTEALFATTTNGTTPGGVTAFQPPPPSGLRGFGTYPTGRVIGVAKKGRVLKAAAPDKAAAATRRR